MTWSELKEEAKKMGAKIYISPYGDGFERIDYKNTIFNIKGDVVVEDRFFDLDVTADLAVNRTPDQMLMIMRGLE